MIADRRLWLTADRKRVVEDGDPAAAFLLAGCAGAVIDDAEADRLGILGRPLRSDGSDGSAATAGRPQGAAPAEAVVSGERRARRRG